MKEKIIKFTVEGDVAAIECDFTCAKVSFLEAEDGKFTVEFPNTNNIHAGSGDGTIVVSQSRRSIFKPKKQEFKIYVPAHTVPAVKINAKNFSAEFIGGIYGELNISAENGSIALSDSVFKNVEVIGGDIDAHLSGVTVKENLSMQIERGELLAENAFATHCECRFKRGNIGLANLNCKDSAFDTLKGNVTASLAGSAESFNTDLVTREGTVIGESVNAAAENSFHAYTQKGNIVLDFKGEEESLSQTAENI